MTDKVDALEIWKRIADSRICQEAAEFYRQAGKTKDEILDQGATDFDQLVNCSGEKPDYKALYYASRHGYMNMHIKQNRLAMAHYLPEARNWAEQRIAFIDFGCGPMTAGLVFAEHLSKSLEDYKSQVSYYGVDISQNMRDLAAKINESFEIYEPARFHLTDSFFDNGALNFNIRDPDICILSFSFALVPKTLKTGDRAAEEIMQNMAQEWHNISQGCKQSWVIYCNPNRSYPRDAVSRNWKWFYATLRKQAGIIYSGGEIKDCHWMTGRNPATMACIAGAITET